MVGIRFFATVQYKISSLTSLLCLTCENIMYSRLKDLRCISTCPIAGQTDCDSYPCGRFKIPGKGLGYHVTVGFKVALNTPLCDSQPRVSHSTASSTQRPPALTIAHLHFRRLRSAATWACESFSFITLRPHLPSDSHHPTAKCRGNLVIDWRHPQRTRRCRCIFHT